MNLDRVTITGADSTTNPRDLINLSGTYPFVEWGILASRNSEGQPRYPTGAWIKGLQGQVRDRQLQPKLSIHLCGHWVRELLLGHLETPDWLFEEFDRVQLNFHAERSHCNPLEFRNALEAIGGERQFIFQLDGVLGNRHMRSLIAVNNLTPLDIVPLYDISGGAGILPPSWPAPVPSFYMGYAGGLGPENLAEQLHKIAEAAADARCWIDMETRVRSRDGLTLDIERVARCLEIAAPFVRG